MHDATRITMPPVSVPANAGLRRLVSQLVQLQPVLEGAARASGGSSRGMSPAS